MKGFYKKFTDLKKNSRWLKKQIYFYKTIEL